MASVGIIASWYKQAVLMLKIALTCRASGNSNGVSVSPVPPSRPLSSFAMHFRRHSTSTRESELIHLCHWAKLCDPTAQVADEYDAGQHASHHGCCCWRLRHVCSQLNG
jgi:hypothetical protein